MPMNTGLLDLAVAVTGAEVDLGRVEVGSEEHHAKLIEMLVDASLADESGEAQNLAAHRQDDGSLLVASGIARYRIPSGEWTTLDAPERDELDADQAAYLEAVMADRLAERSRAAAVCAAMEDSEALVMLFDRSIPSIAALEGFAEAADLRWEVDQWLGTDAPMMVLRYPFAASDCWKVWPVSALGESLRDVLRECAQAIGQRDTVSIVTATADAQVRVEVEREWLALGGKRSQTA